LNVLGIDACKKGWCVVGRIENRLVWGCFTKIEDVVSTYPDVDRILIDIPIGLSSKHFMRTVDAKARKYLEKRKSSLFSPPCREALFANTYKEALAINRAITGKGISIQAYNISSKIKEIDEWFTSKPEEIKVYEAHPELCFKTLNGNQDLQYSKHEKEGLEIRKDIVFHHLEDLKPAFAALLKTYKRSEVKPDDILDAMALLLVNLKPQPLDTIYDENAADETGKKVGIVYG